MNDLDALLFFDEKPEALLLYNALEERIFGRNWARKHQGAIRMIDLKLSYCIYSITRLYM